MNKLKNMLLASVIMLVGCSGSGGDDDPVQPEKEKDTSKIEISTSELKIGEKGGTTTFTFTSNVAWKASSNADWCQIAPSEGSIGGGTLTLTVSANEEFKERKAKITVSGGKAQKNVTLIQEAKKPIDTEGDIDNMPTQPL